MSEIAIIDLEASGLHFDSYPIEVALRWRGEIRQWLIRPEAAWLHWDEAAQKLHGISRTQLLNEGTAARDVAQEINAAAHLCGGIFYSDNAPWDDDWLQTLFRAAGEIRLFHVLPLQETLPDPAAWKRFLANKAELAGKYGAHRAALDVEMIWQAWRMAGAS
ncbi:hypothetical protein V8J88_11395 [Massilia sp. W12]|uniref:3'-5' exonuclease n=1 Tax=Massilia sp. W12 TaxID=3126507 RepID=UPI0030D40379